MHFLGLKCVIFSDLYTAKGLFISAIRDEGFVIIFNYKLIMGRGPNFGLGAGAHVPEDLYEIPIGKVNVSIEGSDITLICTAIFLLLFFQNYHSCI